MGGARLAADRDRMWEMDSGDAARGRNGSAEVGVQDGDVGDDVGDGSVDRRRVGGLRNSSSGDPWTRKLGRGEGRNSSILSVSGTGSILADFVSIVALRSSNGYSGMEMREGRSGECHWFGRGLDVAGRNGRWRAGNQVAAVTSLRLNLSIPKWRRCVLIVRSRE